MHVHLSFFYFSETANESEGEESAVESESEICNTCRIHIQFCSDKNIQLNKEAAEALKPSKLKATSKRKA